MTSLSIASTTDAASLVARPRKGPAPQPVADRFMRLVEKTEGCWLWKASLRRGYGQFFIARGLTVRAHRFSYELHIGAIPDGMMVCHRCDNPICVRPEHLFLGTAKDNARDMIEKGRAPKVSFEERSRRARVAIAGGARPPVARRRTNCAKGHPLTGDNVLRWAQRDRAGRRIEKRLCRICQNAWRRAHRKASV